MQLSSGSQHVHTTVMYIHSLQTLLVALLGLVTLQNVSKTRKPQLNMKEIYREGSRVTVALLNTCRSERTALKCGIKKSGRIHGRSKATSGVVSLYEEKYFSLENDYK